MRFARPGEEYPQRIAVMRALNGLGDLLCIVPALRALREAFPEARVTFIGMPAARGFVARFHQYVDDFLEFPGYPGIVERPYDPRRMDAFLRQVRAADFDLALQLHGSGVVSNNFMVALGARRIAGCYLAGEFCPDEELFLIYPATEPEPLRPLRLMEHLGIPLAGTDLEWPVTAEDEQAFAANEELAGLPAESFACVHAGARDPWRRWPAERFAAAGDWLAGQGLTPVLTGTLEERELVAEVSRRMQAPHVDACASVGIGAMGVLLSRARLLLSNDTGISHLAAALRTPSVVVFSGSDRARWAPLDSELHRAVGAGVPDGIEGMGARLPAVEVAEVISALGGTLASTAVGRAAEAQAVPPLSAHERAGRHGRPNRGMAAGSNE